MEITVDGTVYVPKEEKTEGMEYVLIRTYSAGVHVGFLKSQDGKIVELNESRRIWYWDGAASLSQLATDGVSAPENCKFSVVVQSIVLTEAIEIIPCTDKAKMNIAGVPIWKE